MSIDFSEITESNQSNTNKNLNPTNPKKNLKEINILSKFPFGSSKPMSSSIIEHNSKNIDNISDSPSQTVNNDDDSETNEKQPNYVFRCMAQKCHSMPLILINSDKNTVTLECQAHADPNETLNSRILQNGGESNEIDLETYLKKCSEFFNTIYCSSCEKKHELGISLDNNNKNKSKKNIQNNKFFFCRDCYEYFCYNCHIEHSNESKEHIMIDADKLTSMCLFHNEKFSSYCMNCKKNLCMKCVVEKEHTKHKILNLKTLQPSSEFLANIKKKLVKEQNNIKHLEMIFVNSIRVLQNEFYNLINKKKEQYQLKEALIKEYDKNSFNYEVIMSCMKLEFNTKCITLVKKSSDKNNLKLISQIFNVLEPKINNSNSANNTNNKINEKSRIIMNKFSTNISNTNNNNKDIVGTTKANKQILKEMKNNRLRNYKRIDDNTELSSMSFSECKLKNLNKKGTFIKNGKQNNTYIKKDENVTESKYSIMDSARNIINNMEINNEKDNFDTNKNSKNIENSKDNNEINNSNLNEDKDFADIDIDRHFTYTKKMSNEDIVNIDDDTILNEEDDNFEVKGKFNQTYVPNTKQNLNIENENNEDEEPMNLTNQINVTKAKENINNLFFKQKNYNDNEEIFSCTDPNKKANKTLTLNNNNNGFKKVEENKLKKRERYVSEIRLTGIEKEREREKENKSKNSGLIESNKNKNKSKITYSEKKIISTRANKALLNSNNKLQFQLMENNEKNNTTQKTKHEQRKSGRYILKKHLKSASKIKEDNNYESPISKKIDNKNRVYSIKISEDPVWCLVSINKYKNIAVGLASGHIRIFDQNDYFQNLFIKEHKSAIYSMFEIDDLCLLTSSADKTIKKIEISDDIKSYNVLGIYLGHKSSVYKAINLSNNQILSCGEDSNLLLWGIPSRNNLHKKSDNTSIDGTDIKKENNEKKKDNFNFVDTAIYKSIGKKIKKRCLTVGNNNLERGNNNENSENNKNVSNDISENNNNIVIKDFKIIKKSELIYDILQINEDLFVSSTMNGYLRFWDIYTMKNNKTIEDIKCNDSHNCLCLINKNIMAVLLNDRFGLALVDYKLKEIVEKVIIDKEMDIKYSTILLTSNNLITIGGQNNGKNKDSQVVYKFFRLKKDKNNFEGKNSKFFLKYLNTHIKKIQKKLNSDDIWLNVMIEGNNGTIINGLGSTYMNKEFGQIDLFFREPKK